MHEKIGIIEDAFGSAISFSGSNNETASGWINNVEEFKVFKNWEEYQIPYFKADAEKFEKYWNNESNTLKIFDLSEAEKQNIIRKTNVEDLSIDEIIEKIKQHERSITVSSGDDKPPKRELRQYQKDAITHWKNNNYISVFEMATGTGKTFTSVQALRHFMNDTGSLHCIIGVPLKTLLVQWEHDVSSEFGNEINVIVANPEIDKDWKKKIREISFNSILGVSTNFVILVTYDLFTMNTFFDVFSSVNYKDLLFVADEMHNLVTARRIFRLSETNFKYRLGLSATPTRLWRPNESQKVVNFFGSNNYVFTLERAIKEHFLVPYNYHVIKVELTYPEYEEYYAYTKKIGRLMDSEDEDNQEELERLLRERARIKKNAENKFAEMKKLAQTMKADNAFQYSLLYVDNTEKLNQIREALTSLNIVSAKFTGIENMKERRMIVDGITSKSIDAVVAMKCLDEGVDIPSARKAFFLSSNTDPREYIQRLGRVLRLDEQSGKTISNIYDFVVFPPSDLKFESPEDRNVARNLIKNEMVRVKFFCNLAANFEDAIDYMEDLVDDIGMTFTDDEFEITAPGKEDSSGAAE